MEHTSYPRNLGYSVSALQGYSRDTFKLESTGTTTASGGQGRVITFNLPENSLIDLKSFRFIVNSCVGDYAAGNGGSIPEMRVVIPFSQALISRLEVNINGVQICQGFPEYGTGYRLLRNARTPTSKSTSIDNAVENGIMDTTPASVYANGETIGLAITSWLGFMEAPSTRFVHTGLLGQISIKMTLADNWVMSPIAENINQLAGAALATAQTLGYTLSNFYATIDSISINDGMYDSLLRSKLQRDGFLQINYDEYYSFSQEGLTGNSATIRYSLASQSINKIYTTLRASSYTTRGNAPDVLTSANDIGSIQPAFCKFQSFATDYPPVNFKWNYNINGTMHPQYLASEMDALCSLAHTENKVFMDSPGNQVFSFLDFRASKFCAAIRLNHPIDGETRNCYVSGIDSRGLNSALTFTCSGMSLPAGGATIYSLVNTTSSIRVGPGRQIEVIQ